MLCQNRRDVQPSGVVEHVGGETSPPESPRCAHLARYIQKVVEKPGLGATAHRVVDIKQRSHQGRARSLRATDEYERRILDQLCARFENACLVLFNFV